jgi:hypothetical protein
MTRRLKLAMAFALCLVLAACAAGGVESANAAHQGLASQFLLGVWHGIIAPVTLLVEILHKLFPHTVPWANVRLYEVKANSAAYDLGFFLGLGGGPIIVIRRGWRGKR